MRLSLLSILFFASSSALANVVHLRPKEVLSQRPVTQKKDRRSYLSRLTGSRTTKQKRQDPAPSGSTCDLNDFCCTTNGWCCNGIVPTTPPQTERKRSVNNGVREVAVGSQYTGDVLSPENAVAFILSPFGTYTHMNGTVIPDHTYARHTRDMLYRKASRSIVSRYVAESLGKALLNVIPRSLMIKKLIEIMRYSGTDLYIVSPQTAIRVDDVLPTLKLLAATEGFDGFNLHGQHYPKDVVLETIYVLQTIDVHDKSAFDHAEAKEEEFGFDD